MSITCKTYAEAKAVAADMRATYAGTDWTVRIERPLFDGDSYRVNVGA